MDLENRSCSRYHDAALREIEWYELYSTYIEQDEYEKHIKNIEEDIAF